MRVRFGDRRDRDGVFLGQWTRERTAVTRADFYLIDKPRFRDDPLLLVCELVKKAYAAEQPTLILARTAEQADALDEKLWEFDDESFIPHQIAGDDDDAITAVVIVPPGVRTADRPLVVNLRDECAPGTFERVLEVVAAEPAEREGSRARWTEYKKRGFDVNKHDM
jgi:DNA polymerase-3 subunit chi